jgi:hypothetical protein
MAWSLAESFPGRYAAPCKPAGRRAVTLESDIIVFLSRRRGRLFCDECLTRELRYAQRARIDAVTKAIGGATDAEMDAVVPHSDGRMTRFYRAQADQELLARAAIARLPGNTTETPIDTRTRRK